MVFWAAIYLSPVVWTFFCLSALLSKYGDSFVSVVDTIFFAVRVF